MPLWTWRASEASFLRGRVSVRPAMRTPPKTHQRQETKEDDLPDEALSGRRGLRQRRVVEVLRRGGHERIEIGEVMKPRCHGRTGERKVAQEWGRQIVEGDIDSLLDGGREVSVDRVGLQTVPRLVRLRAQLSRELGRGGVEHPGSLDQFLFRIGGTGAFEDVDGSFDLMTTGQEGLVGLA